jgi:hypothetical protein
MGWLPAARGYAANTDPRRFGNHTFDGRYLARSRRLPGSPWLKGRSERGFAGLPLGFLRRCRALPVGSADLAPDGGVWMRTGEGIIMIARTCWTDRRRAE